MRYLLEAHILDLLAVGSLSFVLTLFLGLLIDDLTARK